MKKLSSELTFFAKVILPLLWISFVTIVYVVFAIRCYEMLIYFIILGIFGLISLYFTSIRLKSIRIDSKKLYISNYLKTVIIEISDIEQVKRNFIPGVGVIWIYFRKYTPFGNKVVFWPAEPISYVIRSDGIFRELEKIVRS